MSLARESLIILLSQSDDAYLGSSSSWTIGLLECRVYCRVWLLVKTPSVSIHGAKVLLKVIPQASHDHILWNELAPIQRSGHIRTGVPHL
jgi:hypothetical protein